jgi:hypothetical protein
LRIVHNQALAGQVDVSIDELHRWRRKCRLRVFEGLTARLIAQTLMATREEAAPEVSELLEEAVAADRSNGTRWHLAQDFACLAELCRRRGDEAGMSESLSQARDIFHECGASDLAAEMERRASRLRRRAPEQRLRIKLRPPPSPHMGATHYFRNLSLSLGQNRRLLNDQLVYSARRRVELVRL